MSTDVRWLVSTHLIFLFALFIGGEEMKFYKKLRPGGGEGQRLRYEKLSAADGWLLRITEKEDEIFNLFVYGSTNITLE
jgi:hypothetical protein